MTGEKNRGTTHEKLWKLDDQYLKTPKHDELVLQLLSKKNCKKVLDLLGVGKYSVGGTYLEYCKAYDENFMWQNKGFSENAMLETIKDVALTAKGGYNYKDITGSLDAELEKLPAEIEKYRLQLNSNIQKFMDSVNTEVMPESIKSEVPVVSGSNRFIIGYIDVQINSLSATQVQGGITNFDYDFDYEVSREEYTGKGGYTYHEPRKVNVKGSFSKAAKVVSHVPKILSEDEARLRYMNSTFSVNIEVKPKIDSFGETLRQINTYREYLPADVFCIYSPDDKFKEAFETQGVPLITPEDIGLV